MDAPRHPVAHPRLAVSPLDSDNAEPMAICELPAADGTVRFAVPMALVELIRLFDGRRSVDDAVAAFAERHPGRYPPERLKTLVEGFLMAKGLVLADADAEPVIERDPSHRRSFLYLKLPLITSRVVDPIANALKWAYSRPVLIAWLPFFIAVHVYAYGVLLPGHHLDFNELNVGGILMLMLLSTIGTLVHELGHASAAAHYGCRRLEIGWGLYLVFTVLYTDVSEAWKLPRRLRAVVDLGGIYFQSVFLAALLGLFAATGDVIYLFGFLFSDLTIASSFNPFLRLDGYWLVSDLFGILNLRQQQMELLRRGWAKLSPARRAAPRAGLDLSRKAVVTLVVYTVLGSVFFVYLAKIMIERVAARIVVGYPQILAEYWTSLVAGEMGFVDVASAVMEILWRTLMLVGIAFFLFNALSRLAGLARRAAARWHGRPVAVSVPEVSS